MAELIGPARCKADILPGPFVANDTFGPPRADSMMAREVIFPTTRPVLRVHPTGLVSTIRPSEAAPESPKECLWADSG